MATARGREGSGRSGAGAARAGAHEPRAPRIARLGGAGRRARSSRRAFAFRPLPDPFSCDRGLFPAFLI